MVKGKIRKFSTTFSSLSIPFYNTMSITIISGGQTGIDRMGLEIARELRFATGGSAPRDFMTELWPDPSLADFGLVALPQKEHTVRTRKNVFDSDGTVRYGDETAGTK